MVRTEQPRIRDAIATVDEEIAIIERERDAFEAFRSRVIEIRPSDPDGPTASASPDRRPMVTPSPDQSPLAAVRRAYRETVMDVPHYEAEYGDTLSNSLEAEFGSELAEAVVGCGALSPLVCEGLETATNRAIADRERLLGILERERNSLEECRKRLNEYEAAAIEVHADLDDPPRETAAGRLRTLHRQCEDVASQRQSSIHDRSVETVSGVEDCSLVGYLYGEDDRVLPVLGDCLDCLTTIEGYLDRIERDSSETRPSVQQ